MQKASYIGISTLALATLAGCSTSESSRKDAQQTAQTNVLESRTDAETFTSQSYGLQEILIDGVAHRAIPLPEGMTIEYNGKTLERKLLEGTMFVDAYKVEELKGSKIEVTPGMSNYVLTEVGFNLPTSNGEPGRHYVKTEMSDTRLRTVFKQEFIDEAVVSDPNGFTQTRITPQTGAELKKVNYSGDTLYTMPFEPLSLPEAGGRLFVRKDGSTYDQEKTRTRAGLLVDHRIAGTSYAPIKAKLVEIPKSPIVQPASPVVPRGLSYEEVSTPRFKIIRSKSP